MARHADDADGLTTVPEALDFGMRAEYQARANERTRRCKRYNFMGSHRQARSLCHRVMCLRCPVAASLLVDRASKQKPAEVAGILTDADLPRASWKLKLSSAGYQKPGTAKLPARERVLALPEQQARPASQPPISWPPFFFSRLLGSLLSSRLLGRFLFRRWLLRRFLLRRACWPLASSCRLLPGRRLLLGGRLLRRASSPRASLPAACRGFRLAARLACYLLSSGLLRRGLLLGGRLSSWQQLSSLPLQFTPMTLTKVPNAPRGATTRPRIRPDERRPELRSSLHHPFRMEKRPDRPPVLSDWRLRRLGLACCVACSDRCQPASALCVGSLSDRECINPNSTRRRSGTR